MTTRYYTAELATGHTCSGFRRFTDACDWLDQNEPSDRGFTLHGLTVRRAEAAPDTKHASRPLADQEPHHA